jgi:S-formylglutathione hydrolase FrmB
MKRMGAVRVWVAAAVLVAVWSGAAAHADETRATDRRAAQAVVVDDTAAPVPSHVIVPQGAVNARWPVVYFFNTVYTGCDDASCGPIIAELKSAPFISVLEDSPAGLGDYVDWRNGSHHNEAAHISLVSYIDAHYPTIPDRAHRIAAGISAGGYGAGLLAADHPDLFGGLASFSGILDLMDKHPVLQAVFVPTSQAPPPHIFSPASPWGPIGVDDVWWRAANPADLVANLADTTVYDAAATGIPCDGREAQSGGVQEAIVRDTSDSFDHAADEAGVGHTSRRLNCGQHDYEHTFQTEIRDWLSRRLPTQGNPATFDYRAVRRTFSVYGWTFTADPRRAPEFLVATDVSRQGFTLTGSGRTTVMTPAWFQPNQLVSVGIGGTRQQLAADNAGRLTMTVDLGPAHAVQEYTAQQWALQLRGGYWHTKHITLSH